MGHRLLIFLLANTQCQLSNIFITTKLVSDEESNNEGLVDGRVVNEGDVYGLNVEEGKMYQWLWK